MQIEGLFLYLALILGSFLVNLTTILAQNNMGEDLYLKDVTSCNVNTYLSAGTGIGSVGGFSTYSASFYLKKKTKPYILGISSARLNEQIKINKRTITKLPVQTNQELGLLFGCGINKQKLLFHLATGPAYLGGKKRGELVQVSHLQNGTIEEYEEVSFRKIGGHIELFVAYMAAPAFGLGANFFVHINNEQRLWGLHVTATFRK